MPVEIRELVIRAVIKDSQSPNQDIFKGGSQEEQDLTALVEACVKQVLKIIKRKQER
jgi:hypothetical protein